MGCDPFDVEAADGFLVCKVRKEPLPVLTSDIQSTEKVAYVSKEAKGLAERFSPELLELVVSTITENLFNQTKKAGVGVSAPPKPASKCDSSSRN